MSNRYLNELVKLHCGSDLLATKFFPNAKEITESFAAYSATRRYLWDNFPPDDPTVTLVAVGDGTWPRTGAVFAFRTAWQCISVDPLIHENAPYKEGNRAGMKVERLMAIQAKVEDARLTEFYCQDEPLVIVCVHSHAPMPAVLTALPAKKRAVIAIPCCVPQEIPGVPLIEYRDNGILSPCNLVKVWPKS